MFRGGRLRGLGFEVSGTWCGGGVRVSRMEQLRHPPGEAHTDARHSERQETRMKL